MKIKRYMVFLLTVCMLNVILGGCTVISKNNTDNKLPEIIIGSDTYPPYVYLNNDGIPTGIDVDIATEAFKRIGYKAVFQTIDWEKKKSLVDNGKIDCIWGCFSMSGRESEYKWAGPYMVSRQVVAVNSTSDIKKLSDLANKIVAVQITGKPEEIFLKRTNKGIPKVKEIISLEDRSVQYASLECGYVDAIAAHETAILQYMKDYDADFRILDDVLLTTGIGVAFSNNDERGLDKKLSDTLEEMRSDGTMKKIVGKYLEEPEKYLEVDKLED